MKSLKNFKTLKASSLLESVIAISIISICVLVASMIYINVVKQNDSIHYFNAKHKIEKLINETIDSKDYDDNIYRFEGYSIDKRTIINEDEHTVLLKFIIKTGDKKYVVNKLIFHEN